jgi:hypothetical protein
MRETPLRRGLARHIECYRPWSERVAGRLP